MARSIEETRARIWRWEETIRADSAMYARLARDVAEREEILELLTVVPMGQLELNMLFAAVQYLLLAAPDEPLAAWYPSLGGTRTDAQLEDVFAAFVLDHQEQIRELITSRRVQTNEVARCVFLLPAYNLVQRMAGLPLAVAEIGTSAGLNQNVDRYGYTYRSRSATSLISPHATVQLETDCGDEIPDTADGTPHIAWRMGVDLHPIDVTDPDEARWLRSLVWPDQVARHTRLANAIELTHEHPPVVEQGDAFAALPGIVAAAPEDCALVIQHSFVLNQFSAEDREGFFDLLDELAGVRRIYRVGAEWLTRIRSTVLSVAEHGPERNTIELGDVHHHGSWIRLADR